MPEPALLSALRDLAPKGVGCGWADPRLDHGLWEGERLPAAIPSRLNEFSAGRTAARAAMAALGIAPAAVPHGPSREPIWPGGLVGSITHTPTQCLAVVVPATLCRGIGIDLEEHADLSPDLWPSVLHPTEWERVTKIPQCHQAKMALSYFCAKEAAYKAQYPISHQLLEFQDLIVTFQSGSFEAQFQRGVSPFDTKSSIFGRIKAVGQHLLALATC